MGKHKQRMFLEIVEGLLQYCSTIVVTVLNLIKNKMEKEILVRAEQLVSFMDFLEKGEQVTISLSNTKPGMYRVMAPRDMVDSFKLEEYSL